MLSGVYSYRDLADVSARIIWDKSSQTLKARPATQRLAVGSAGTIPDRGMYSVVLPEGDGKQGRRRVGELDEEMVHESRVGDVIALGTTTWQITEIAADRVMVKPAPGKMARLPFWHGEALARNYAAGCARGAFLRDMALELEAAQGFESVKFSPTATARLVQDGLDEFAQENLAQYLGMQKAATHVIPTDKHLVVEQCEDETGQWRIMLHSPFGRRVHEPWALAVAKRLMDTEGFDAQVGANDDGIILRYPMTEAAVPGAELFLFDPDELTEIVTHLVETTALFAARFRECAARALILRTKGHGKRMPLWQQRHAAGQLLEVARTLPDFPITLEAARECLVDVFDLTALAKVMQNLASNTIRMTCVQTQTPSPFAANLLFGYVGDHLYDTDMPHAERAASLLSVDPELLKELLGTQDMSALVDPSVERDVQAQLQRLGDYKVPGDKEQLFDVVMRLGYLSLDDIKLRVQDSTEDCTRLLDQLVYEGRLACFTHDEKLYWASLSVAWCLAQVSRVCVHEFDVVERTHEALGKTAPSEIEDLAYVFAKTHTAFSVQAFAQWAFVGEAFAREALAKLASLGVLMQGSFGADAQGFDRSYISVQVFKRARALTQTQIQARIRPVGADAYMRFLFDLQGRGNATKPHLQGVEGVAEVIAQFEGLAFSPALWESTIFPMRVTDYKPAYLDELLDQGEVIWVAQGSGAEMLVSLYPADSPFAPLPYAQVASPEDALAFDEASFEGERLSVAQIVVRALAQEGPCRIDRLIQAIQDCQEQPLETAQVFDVLRSLIAQGKVSSTSAAYIRQSLTSSSKQVALSKGQTPPPRAQRRVQSRRSASRFRSELYAAKQTARQSVIERTKAYAAYGGEWSLLTASQETPTAQAIGMVEALLDCYGVITRDSALLAGFKGGLSALYPVLRQMEEQGLLVRGMFVEELGPVQFATTQTIDTLRSYVSSSATDEMFVLAADDPACLFGAGLSWPATTGEKLSRKKGNVVVMCAGKPILFASAGLKHLATFVTDEALLVRALKTLVACSDVLVQEVSADARARKKLIVQTCDGASVFETKMAAMLAEAGFVRMPDGMRLYASPF